MLPTIPPPGPEESQSPDQTDTGNNKRHAETTTDSAGKSRKLLLRRMRCPSCRGRDIEEAASSSLATFAVSVFFILLLVGIVAALLSTSHGSSSGTSGGCPGWWYTGNEGYTHRCRSCGTTWNINKARNSYGGWVLGFFLVGLLSVLLVIFLTAGQ
jgi:hypothetical protein